MRESAQQRTYSNTVDARIVKSSARGNWIQILTALCPGLSNAAKNVGKHVPCPDHGGENGFRFFKDADDTGGSICNTCGTFDDGFKTLQWYHDWDFPTAVAEVAEFLRLTPKDNDSARPVYRKEMSPPVESESDRRKREYKDKKLREELTRIWHESLPLDDSRAEPARLYLARRGLALRHALKCENLRFHQALPYFQEGQISGYHPGIVAMVLDAKAVPVTIHRTFLDQEGYKACVPSPKKLMPYPSDRNLKGAFIPLAKLEWDYPGRDLGITEGIETGLAVIEASEGRLPVWVMITARIMQGFTPPIDVEHLYAYGDQDGNNTGLDTIKSLKTRLLSDYQDLAVTGFLPPRDEIPEGDKSVDWLDIFVKHGSSAIPMPKGIREVLH